MNFLEDRKREVDKKIKHLTGRGHSKGINEKNSTRTAGERNAFEIKLQSFAESSS